MRWLVPIGIFLMVAGAGGAVAAYMQSATNDSSIATREAGDGVPATRANRSGTAGLVLAPLSGLALAFGVGCVGVGMGRWSRPVPSRERTANPWSEQPGEKGDPPTGLV